jgi:hypothetical protein
MTLPPKEFVKNSNVKVIKSDDVDLGNFAEFLNNNNNNNSAGQLTGANLNAIGREVMLTSPLRYTNFIAEVGPITRPDVLKFVRKTKPLRVDGNFNVREISGYHGKFQKGVTHTNLYGFKVHQNLEPAQLQNQPWTFIEFRVAVKQKKMIIARMYKDKMVIQGGCVDNDPETPLKVGKYIVNKYLGQNSADLTVKYASLDASFQVNGVIPTEQLSNALKRNGVKHSYVQEMKASDVRGIEYEGQIIDSVTINGFITLHKKSLQEIQRAYRAALKFVERMRARGLITLTGKFAPVVEKNVEPPPRKVNVPRVQKLTNNSEVLLNNKVCSKYSPDELKQICKAMGIFTKKTWKKKDMCQAIFEKSSNLALERAFNKNGNGNRNRKRNNAKVFKNRDIDNASIRKMITKAYGASFTNGRNVNADLRNVKNGMATLKKNKRGVPFKVHVVKLVKEVVTERKLKTYLNKFDPMLRPLIRRRIKTVSKKAVDTEGKKLQKLKLSKNDINVLKNKNIKPNVNLKTYAKQRRLILAYTRAVALRQGERNAVRERMNTWLDGQNKSPNNDEVKRKLVRTLRNIVNSAMNLTTMEKLYARRAKFL